jgi:hypothetical protein
VNAGLWDRNDQEFIEEFQIIRQWHDVSRNLYGLVVQCLNRIRLRNQVSNFSIPFPEIPTMENPSTRTKCAAHFVIAIEFLTCKKFGCVF